MAGYHKKDGREEEKWAKEIRKSKTVVVDGLGMSKTKKAVSWEYKCPSHPYRNLECMIDVVDPKELFSQGRVANLSSWW